MYFEAKTFIVMFVKKHIHTVDGLKCGGGAYNRNKDFVSRYMGLYPGELIKRGDGILIAIIYERFCLETRSFGASPSTRSTSASGVPVQYQQHHTADKYSFNVL